MTDSSEIGRFGTLRLLKRHEPETTVAFFPIDDEEVTFGRSKQCSVRLYYNCVSELHCTLQISEEHKAFLLVQGTNGLLIDGCQVNPSTSPGSSPTTVPLTNGSEIEIYKKRFRFEYPPKEIRAALLATPRHQKSRRSLRMSMIQSAQVLTPQPSPSGLSKAVRRGSIKDNADWEQIRSPIRMPDDNNGTQEMMLLEGQGDDAVVVEEGKDLIILEQVENHSHDQKILSSPSKQTSRPVRSVAFSIPKATPSVRPALVPQSTHSASGSPRTPMNRRRSALSLHRAVVLRSAQRAQLERERERERSEEQQEEDEVEAVVSPERELGPLEHTNGFDENEEEDENSEEIKDDPHIVHPNKISRQPAARGGVFRTSLDAMKKAIPLTFGWSTREDDDEDDDNNDGDNDDDEQSDEGELDEDNAQTQTPIRRNLGPFMTPQIWVNRPAQRVPVDVKARASLGGSAPQGTFGAPQRVRIVPPWKVQDIILPEPEKPHLGGAQESKGHITEEERQSIIARRKSALQTFTPLPMPGPRDGAFPPRRLSDLYTPGEDSDEDAETMLAKMKQKMANVRRKSEARKVRLSIASPHKTQDFSLLAAARSDRAFLAAGILEETFSQTKHAEEDDAARCPAVVHAQHKQQEEHLSILDGSDDEERVEHSPIRTTSGVSLTPRFDGVREMFRQPRMDPKTPSFAGLSKMLYAPAELSPKTPSFRGVREMFNPPLLVPPTPQLNLGSLFSNEEGRIGNGGADSWEETGHVEDEAPVIDEEVGRTPPSIQTSTHIKISASKKRTSRKKNAATIDIPSAVPEDILDERGVEGGDTSAEEPEPAVSTTRRATKRTAKQANTPIAESDGESGGHGLSQSIKKGSSDNALAERTVPNRTRRTRRVANENSEDEFPGQGGSGGRRRLLRGQQTNEEIADEEAEFRHEKTVGNPDTEEEPAPRTCRGRTPKQRQADAEESVPTKPRSARRIKSEDPDPVALPPAARPVKSRRGTKAQQVETVDEEDSPVGSGDNGGRTSELDDVTPAPGKSKGAKKGSTRKTPVVKEFLSDKENADHSSKKTPTTRGRRTPVTTTAEVMDAPAKRTRSRK
ncbi:hypothetical protein K439DRAFT_1631219 [Ramaria rubella]|nr:hypothetical protein K439DRAFT_1631219 [Ramaria rubella]